MRAKTPIIALILGYSPRRPVGVRKRVRFEHLLEG